MEIFTKIALSLEDILESELRRLDIQYVESESGFIGYATYKNEKEICIYPDGRFHII